jgi:hypothetical protein
MILYMPYAPPKTESSRIAKNLIFPFLDLPLLLCVKKCHYGELKIQQGTLQQLQPQPSFCLGRAGSTQRRVHKRMMVVQRDHTSIMLLLLLRIVVSWLLVLGRSATAAAADTAAERVIPAATTAAADWVATCRSQGFDPEQLACSTCDILPLHFTDECRACCQEWLDTPHMNKPYEAAILVDRGSLSTELSQFLTDDWDSVVSNKGGASRLRRVEQYPTLGGSARSQSFFSSTYQPSTILFFNDKAEAKEKDVDLLTSKAVETVSLDGMKRDDIKNMLLALLP